MEPSQQSTGSAIVRFYDPDIRAKDALGRTQEQILAWSNSELEYSHNYIQMLFPLPEGSPFNWSAPVIDLGTMEDFRSRSELRQQLRSSFERMLTFYGFAGKIAGQQENASTEDGSAVAAITADSSEEGSKEVQNSTATAEDTVSSDTSDKGEGIAARTWSAEAAPSESTSQSSSSIHTIIRGENWGKASRNWCVRFDHNHLRITRILRCLRVLGLDKESGAFFAALKQVYNDPAIDIGARSMQYWKRAAERPLHLPPDDNEEECEWLKAWAKKHANGQ